MALKVQKHASSSTELPSHVTQSGTRLTPEMSNAIRRQREISRMDYWKTGFSGLGLINSPNSSPRRPTYPKLARVHVDQIFPALYMPSAISVSQQKLRQRAHMTPTLVFSRSRTTLAPSTSHFNENASAASRNASTSELTSMQTSDTLSSPRQAVFSNLLTHSPMNSRQIDILSDDDSSSEDENVVIFNNNTPKEIPVLRQERVKERHSNSLPSVNYKTFEPYDSNNKSELSRQLSSPITTVLTTSLDEKPSKPILKNGANKTDKDLLTRAICSTLNRSNTNLDPVPQQPQSKATQTVYPDFTIYPTPFGQTTRREEVTYRRPRESTVSIVHSGADSSTDLRTDLRKRSVTFNSDHKVHEYIPHEPICS